MSYSKKIHEKLADDFWQNYSADEIRKSFEKRIKTFFLAHETLLNEEGVPDQYFIAAKSKRNLNKTLLTELAAIVFLTKKIFKAFKAAQEEEVQLILDEIIWEKQLHQNTIKEKLGIQIWETTEEVGYSGQVNLHHTLLIPIHFFRYKRLGYYSYSNKNATYTISLPFFLRKHLVQFYPRQKGADLMPLDKPESTEYLYDKGARDIFLELQRMLAYENQGNIKVSKKNKVQTSTLGKMQRKLNLQEFYTNADNDKNLKIMRTTLLAGLVVWSSISKTNTDLKQILKTLITQKYTTHYKSIHGLMYHLKGNGNIDFHYTTAVGDIFLDLIKKLPHGKWVSVENIENYLKYNFIDIKHIVDWVAQDKLYYEVVVEFNKKPYKEKLYINSDLYEKAITQPLIRGTLFLFAAFGLLDIAYDTPDVSALSETAYSYYDGLKYVKLNDLGAFVIGKTNEYSIPEEVSNTKIKLSEDSLTIVSDENDPTAAIILEPYTQKVTPNRFRTDFSIFLKGVTNKTELKSKINSFRQFIPELPENWQIFFKELDRKIDPLSKVSNISIFKIPTDDPVLINLIAKDEVFQKVVMKAEGYHILVTRKNLPKFKERMREYGYLLSK